MRRMCRAIPAFAALAVAAVQAEWSNVTFAFREGEANSVVGPDRAYEVTRPDTGQWAASFDLRNHFANLGGHDIRVHSAKVVRFGDYNAASGHSGRASHICFMLRFSDPVTGFRWDIGGHGKDVTPGSVLAARYSLDGANWRDACVYPPGQGTWDPPAVTLALDRPTRKLYLGWFADVPGGQRAWWNLGNTGVLTFATAAGGAPPGLSVERVPAPTSLHGSRFVPNSFFGTTTHVNGEKMIGLMGDLNFRNVRIDFRWSGLEPERGKYDFNPEMWMNRSADLGVTHGLDQLPVVSMAPKWAIGENGTFPNDESVDALEEFMFRIATKYKGKITHWQAMNEPNLAVWKERYLVFLKAFHRGVKRADPNNKVVLCGFAGVASKHLDAAYRLGGKDYFDVIASHSYTRPRMPEEGGYVAQIRALHDVMTRYGDSKPLWVTEMGWNGVEPSMLEYLRSKFPGHRSYACTEEDQARGLARLYLISATIPWIERVYFFHLHQEAPYTKVMEHVDYYMGLFTPWLRGQLRPKDAYFAMKTVIEMINESTFRERLELGSRTWALVFERGEEATVALWSLDDGVTMRLPDASAIQSVTSMVGTPVLVSDGSLPLSGRPVYVKTPRDHLDSLKNAIGRAELIGGCTIQLALSLDTEKTTAGKPALAVRLTNTSRRDRVAPTVYLRVRPPTWELAEDRISDARAIPAGGARSHSLQLTGADAQAAEVSFVASARLFDDETQVRSERTIRYLVVGRRPKGFAADGSLGEWSRVGPVTIGSTPSQREYVSWRGPEDCAARWYCASDARALHFAAEVRDDVHHQSVHADTADAMWRDDSIQIGFDVAGDAQPVANVPQYDGVDDVEIGLALTADGPIAYAWDNPRSEAGLLESANFAIARDEAAKVTRYEIALPWASLGLAAAPAGRWMGMNVLVNDNDGKGRRGWLEWAPGIGYAKDPSQFPKVLIAGARPKQ